MKKFTLFLMMLLPMAIALSSCSEDSDLPNVNVSVTFQDVVDQNDVIYVVQGDNIQIESINVSNNEAGKGAFITNVTYYIDYQRIAYSDVYPFSLYIPTKDMPVGNHILRISCTIGAVGKAIAQGLVEYPVVVVASADDLPGEDDGQTRTISQRGAMTEMK